jgi:predicted extracellular nuclease
VNTGQTFGVVTVPTDPVGVCGDPATLIHDIQGSGLASGDVGSIREIEAVVVATFQSPDQIGGYFVQEEDTDADADPLTSEGLRVFDTANTPSVGDVVRIRGSVTEFFDLTELNNVVGFAVCGSGGVATPATVSLPVTSVDDFEKYEGMAVTFPQALYISEFFNFDRFGEIVLTTDRRFQPTATFEPGSSAVTQAMQDFLLNRITLDDGRGNQNPDPAIHPDGNDFDLTSLFRGGDTVANVTGVMDYAFGLYRIQPTQGADYVNANPRTASPDDVGGSLKVASFNVLNYFTTLDDGVNDICGPLANQECRGADDANEFTRQRDKIIAALVEIDADVVGLIEIENHPADVPTADLVSGLNDVLGAGTYDYIATGAIGSDAIRVAFIYKPTTASPVGNFAVLDTSVDARFLDDFNRPALAQTFQDNTAGGIFTVAVNHLKSKGSNCNSIDDPDTGDGSGNCNLTRKAAAEALVDWLATDPTGSGDEDFLIIGDLNSYDKEDPIDAILKGSDDTLGTGDDYTDLLFQFIGEDAYSYLFDGQLGYLDHALSNADMLGEVSGTTVWHINADEADLIDYDTTFKGPNQDAIYAPDAYRSSDHDPVIIGLDVCDEIAPTFDELSVSPDTLWPANHKYVDVTATVVVSDNFDPNPTVTLVSVTSNEPDNGLGDGDTANDMVIVDDFHFKLRAERSGKGEGRFYTITYMVTDACGNSVTQSVTVTVPKSQGKNK